MLLLFTAGVLYLFYRRKVGSEIGWLGLGLVGAFVLYSALLRWSQWNARYLIPILVLGAALSSVVLVRTLPKWAVDDVVALTLLVALPLALANRRGRCWPGTDCGGVS